MLKMKRLLVVMLTALTMILAANMVVYADETNNTQTEESAEDEGSAVILAGESHRKKDADTGAAEVTADTENTVQTDSDSEDRSGDSTSSDFDEHNTHNSLTSLGHFRTTAYCPCYSCSEGYGRHTSTGAIAKSNHTIAVDPRVIPYGSKVMINGTVYTAEDRGGGVKGKHIDIFYDTHSQTRQYGSRNVEVFLLS